MKISDIKLIGRLPDEYDYDLFNDGAGNIMVLGKNGQNIIGYRIGDGELRSISLDYAPKNDE